MPCPDCALGAYHRKDPGDFDVARWAAPFATSGFGRVLPGATVCVRESIARFPLFRSLRKYPLPLIVNACTLAQECGLIRFELGLLAEGCKPLLAEAGLTSCRVSIPFATPSGLARFE